MDATATVQTAAQPPRIKFVDGALTGIRPVLEGDLEALVGLLNESPIPMADNVPWTLARLKTKFEDEKEPGLWDDEQSWFTVTRLADDSACGLLKENHRRSGEVWLKAQIANSLPDRREAFRDALATYVRYKSGFGNVIRINAELLDTQTQEAQWLTELEFIPQCHVRDIWMHLGQPAGVLVYSWIPAWVMAQRAPDGGAAE